MRSDNNQHGIDRRRFIKATGGVAGAGIIAGCTGSNAAQGDFPEQSVKFLIPYSTGGGYNYYARLVAQYINENDYLSVEVQAQNKSGGGGVVGHNEIANAQPDGYTNGIVNPDSMAKAQLIRDEARFDLSELTYYPRVAGRTAAIGVGTHTDVESGTDFINAMSNGELKVGTSGITDSGTMIPIALGRAGNVFSEDQVLDNHVQFDGKGSWITSIQREEVDVMAASLSSLLPFAESGDIRLVLVLTTEDSASQVESDTDTLTDLDVDDPEGIVSLAGGRYHRVFAGPPDIPEENAEIIREAIKKAIQNEELQNEAENNDRPISFLNSDETKEGVRNTVQLWQDNRDLLEKLMDQ